MPSVYGLNPLNHFSSGGTLCSFLGFPQPRFGFQSVASGEKSLVCDSGSLLLLPSSLLQLILSIYIAKGRTKSLALWILWFASKASLRPAQGTRVSEGKSFPSHRYQAALVRAV